MKRRVSISIYQRINQLPLFLSSTPVVTQEKTVFALEYPNRSLQPYWMFLLSTLWRLEAL